MTSIQARYSTGPRTYEAVENLLGGTVVEARAGGIDNPGVGIAPDASKKVRGVALTDATLGGNAPRSPSNGVLDQQLTPVEVAVQSIGWVPIKYSAACAYGAKVAAGALGTVRPWVSGDGADAIIGSCEEKGGVAQNVVGLTHINIV